MAAAPPPSKQEQIHKLLERGSVFVHLDPRRDGVVVPPWLGKEPRLVLQIGLNFPIPIHDLEIDAAGVRCTLSFNRTPFFCVLPWSAVYALVAEDGQVSVWPSEIPSELVPHPEPAARKEGPREKREKDRAKRPRISVVPPAPPVNNPPHVGSESPKPTTAPSKPTSVPSARPAPALAPARLAARDGGKAPDGSSKRSSDGGNGSLHETPPPRSPKGPKERPPYLRLVK